MLETERSAPEGTVMEKAPETSEITPLEGLSYCMTAAPMTGSPSD